MYNLTDIEKRAFQTGKQYAEITMDDLKITNEDILEGGLVINRSTQSGTSIEIGSVIAAELALQLTNPDGRFDDVEFEGGVPNVVLKAADAYDEFSMPMGVFTIDQAEKQNGKIQITALDKMAAFDKTATGMTDMTLMNVVLWCASRCHVTCNMTAADFAEFPNYNVTVTAVVDGEHTYREILSWACECMGVCAYADWAGRLMVGWYSDTGLELSNADIKESTIQQAENAITVTGVKIGDETQYGVDGYVIQITDNDFATEKKDVIGPALLTWLNGFSYTPISMTVLPMPWIWPLDGGTVNGTQTIISNMTFKLNGYTALSVKGETTTKKGMAQANPLTKRESALVKALQNAARAETDEKIDALLLMNQLAAYSMGLYPHVETLADGSKIFTYTDKPTLAASTKVYRFNANGFFVSNDGGQTWNSGLDSDGNLLVHILTADIVRTGLLSAVEINIGNGTFTVDQNGNVVANSLTSNNANITGGRIQIVTESEYSNVISLEYTYPLTQTKTRALMRPGQLIATQGVGEANPLITNLYGGHLTIAYGEQLDRGADIDLYVTSNGTGSYMMMSDPNAKDRIFLSCDTNSPDIQVVSADNTMSSTMLENSVRVNRYISQSDYKNTEVYVNSFATGIIGRVNGTMAYDLRASSSMSVLQLGDITTGHVRVQLSPSGLTFFDSNGNITKTYSAT